MTFRDLPHHLIHCRDHCTYTMQICTSLLFWECPLTLSWSPLGSSHVGSSDSQRLWYHTWRWNECPWIARFHFARPPAVGLLFAHRIGKTKAWGFLARKLCGGVDEKGELLRVTTHQGESREYGDQERELYGPTIWLNHTSSDTNQHTAPRVDQCPGPTLTDGQSIPGQTHVALQRLWNWVGPQPMQRSQGLAACTYLSQLSTKTNLPCRI